MADYRFGYRSRSPSYEEYPSDEEYPLDEEWSYSSDCPTHPVRMDPDGRRYGTAWNPGVGMDPDGRRYGTARNPAPQPNGGYLVQTESYVVRPPAFSGYGYAPKVDYRMSSGFVDNSKWHSSPPMPSPYNDRPPEVEKFLTKVQAEASRPLGFSPPVTRNLSYNCYPPEYEDNYTRYRNEGRQPAQFGIAPPPARGNWIRNPDPVSHGMYPPQSGYRAPRPTRIERSTIEPSLASGLGRRGNYPGMVNQYQPGRDLSKPIDDINEIAEYLKRAAKPLFELKPATPIRDAAPEVSGMEDAVKPQNNYKSLPEVEAEPELKKPERTTADVAHTGMVTSREAVPTTAYMAHSTGTINSREAAKRFNGVLM